MNIKKIITIGIFAFIGWAICGAIIGIGREIMSLETTLVVHAIGAPIVFVILSAIYTKKFAYTKPLITALIFTGFVIAMDAGLVAPVFEKSYEMFESLIGTWIPFVLIFLATYLTGSYIDKVQEKRSIRSRG